MKGASTSDNGEAIVAQPGALAWRGRLRKKLGRPHRLCWLPVRSAAE